MKKNRFGLYWENYGFSYFNVFIDRVQNQGFPGRYRKPKTADSRYGFFGRRNKFTNTY